LTGKILFSRIAIVSARKKKTIEMLLQNEKKRSSQKRLFFTGIFVSIFMMRVRRSALIRAGKATGVWLTIFVFVDGFLFFDDKKKQRKTGWRIVLKVCFL